MFKVSTTGLPIRESSRTFLGQGIGAAHVGRAATIVVGGPDNTVKLAGEDDPILGQIQVVEEEQTGEVIVNVLILGGYDLPADPTPPIPVGHKLVGAVVGGEAGFVKSGGVDDTLRNFVTENDLQANGIVVYTKL